MLFESELSSEGTPYDDRQSPADLESAVHRPSLADQAVRASAAAGAASIDPVLAAQGLSIDEISQQTGLSSDDVRTLLVAVVARGLEQTIVDAAHTIQESMTIANVIEDARVGTSGTIAPHQPVRVQTPRPQAPLTLGERIQQYLANWPMFGPRRAAS